MQYVAKQVNACHIYKRLRHMLQNTWIGGIVTGVAQVRRQGYLFVLIPGISVACSKPNTPEGCSGDAIPLSGGVCLNMDASGDLAIHRSLIKAEVERTLGLVRAVLPITDLQVSVIANPSGVIPEIGLGGFNPSGREVQIFGDPSLPDVAGILERELAGILSHEIHHALRRRAIGYGSTLLQASVSEGLADHFALEIVGGDPPPWSTALTEQQLEVWLPQVVANDSGGYDHAEWFFGVGSVPRWTGYTVGFELVSRYLEGRPGSLASGLVGEPAKSFVPSTE